MPRPATSSPSAKAPCSRLRDRLESISLIQWLGSDAPSSTDNPHRTTMRPFWGESRLRLSFSLGIRRTFAQNGLSEVGERRCRAGSRKGSWQNGLRKTLRAMVLSDGARLTWRRRATLLLLASSIVGGAFRFKKTTAAVNRGGGIQAFVVSSAFSDDDGQ